RRAGRHGDDHRGSPRLRRAPSRDEARHLSGAPRWRSGYGSQPDLARGRAKGPSREGPMKLAGVDVGSTTVKAMVVVDGRVAWQAYQRHNTRQAEKVLEFLDRMEGEAGLAIGSDRVFFTGSGAGFIAPLVGAKVIQEVVAVAASVDRLHPDVRF